MSVTVEFLVIALLAFLPVAANSGAWWLWARLPKVATPKELHCGVCAYDLAGLWPVVRCPECGQNPRPGEKPPPAFNDVGAPWALAMGPIGAFVGSIFAAGMMGIAWVLLDEFMGISSGLPFLIADAVIVTLIGATIYVAPVVLLWRRTRRDEHRLLVRAIVFSFLTGFVGRGGFLTVQLWNDMTYGYIGSYEIVAYGSLAGLVGFGTCGAGLLLAVVMIRRGRIRAWREQPVAPATVAPAG